MATCGRHCSFWQVQHHASVSPKPMFPSVEREPRGDIQPPLALRVALWESLLWFRPHGAHRGNPQGSTIGSLIEKKKWGRASNNQYLGLGRLSSYLQSPSNNLNQWLRSSVEPGQWHSLGNLVGCSSA